MITTRLSTGYFDYNSTLFFPRFEPDEKKIISIIDHRNAVQRKLIRYAYEEIYQEDLSMQLESELSGEFEVIVLNQ